MIKSSTIEWLRWIYWWQVQETVPNILIALRLFLKLTVFIVTVERSSSKLKLNKSYLKSSMSQDCLSNLSLISIKHETVVTRFWAFIVCVAASQVISLFFGAKPTQRACTRDLPRDRNWRREGRSQRKTSESAEGSSRDQLTEQTVKEMRVGHRVDQSTEVKKGSCWDLLTYRGRVNQREKMSALLVALREFSFEYTLALAHRMHSVTDFSFLVSRANPSLCLFVLFFHPLSCVLCVRKEMCNAPGRRWEKPLDDLI